MTPTVGSYATELRCTAFVAAMQPGGAVSDELARLTHLLDARDAGGHAVRLV
jgi:hypothetical protein